MMFYHLHITRFSNALFSSSRAKIRGVTLFFDPLSLLLTMCSWDIKVFPSQHLLTNGDVVVIIHVNTIDAFLLCLDSTFHSYCVLSQF